MAVNLKPEGAEVEKLNPYHSLQTRHQVPICHLGERMPLQGIGDVSF